MSTSIDDFPAGSAERVEWEDIRDRNVDVKVARERRLEQWFPGHQMDAETIYGQPDIHSAAVQAVTAAGWLLFPDVSEHQGAFDWAWCRNAGLKVGAFKRGEGRTYTDGQAGRNAQQVAATMDAGLEYHFAYWSAEYDANPGLWEAQGEFFGAASDPDNAHAIDVEMACHGTSTAVDRIVRGYYRELTARGHPNHPLLIYTNRGLWGLARAVPSDPSSLGPGGIHLWVAGYAPGTYIGARGSLSTQWAAVPAGSDGGLPFLGWGGGEFTVMQFTDHAAVAGQSVDGNAFHGTVADFRARLITGGTEDMPLTEAEWTRLEKIVQDNTWGAGFGKATVRTAGQLLAETWATTRDDPSAAQVAVEVGRTVGDIVDSHLAAKIPDIAAAVVAAQGSGPGGALTAGDVEDALRRVISTSRLVSDAR